MQKLSSIGLDTEVHNGVNGKNITIKPSIYDHYKFITYKNKMYLYNSTIRLNGAKMTRGEFGCAWSHLELLKRLVEEPTTSASTPISYYLILEDDVELVKPPDELYKLLQHIPDDTDMCHLAKSDWYPFEKTNQINPYFYECKKNFFNKTTAYLVSKKGAAKIVAYIENSINVPIDDLYNMIYRLTPDFRFYVPFEYFFKEQDNISSTIHDINNQSC
jgi:GR25 family glycosyltransferase involved in LPS biosynthesis